MKKYNKLGVAIVIILVILVVGYFGTRKYLWWFTYGYSSRQTVQSFFSDASKGKTTQAYALTTTAFHSKNTLTRVQSMLDGFSGDKLKITYSRYTKAVNSSGIVVVGSVKDTTTDTTSNFLINVVNNKIDSLDALSYPSKAII